MKSWVIIKWIKNTDFVSAGKIVKGNPVGSISVWKTDDYQIWDSPAYEVLGYFDGPFRDAKKYAKSLNQNITVNDLEALKVAGLADKVTIIKEVK